MQYNANFNGCKNDNLELKFFDYFLIFAVKNRSGYMYPLEPPKFGGSNEYPQSMFKSKYI